MGETLLKGQSKDLIGLTGRIPYGGPVYEIERVIKKHGDNDWLVQVILVENNEVLELKLSELQVNVEG